MPPIEPSFDYYSELGVSPSANSEVLRAAYRRQALANHPDKNQETDSTEKMKRVNEAYDTLKDPRKRKDYDFLRSKSVIVDTTEQKREVPRSKLFSR